MFEYRLEEDTLGPPGVTRSIPPPGVLVDGNGGLCWLREDVDWWAMDW